MLREAVLRRALDPADLVFEDEVGHAGHGVGAVGGRGAAGDHLEAVDQQGRDHVGVDAVAGVVRHHAAAIDQHQGAVGAEAAQVGVVLGGGGVVRAAGALTRAGGLEGRKLVGDFPDGHGRPVLHRRRADDRDRCRGGEARRQARARDHHLLHLRRGRGGLGVSRLAHGQDGHRNGPHQHRNLRMNVHP